MSFPPCPIFLFSTLSTHLFILADCCVGLQLCSQKSHQRCLLCSSLSAPLQPYHLPHSSRPCSLSCTHCHCANGRGSLMLKWHSYRSRVELSTQRLIYYKDMRYMRFGKGADCAAVAMLVNEALSFFFYSPSSNALSFAWRVLHNHLESSLFSAGWGVCRFPSIFGVLYLELIFSPRLLSRASSWPFLPSHHQITALVCSSILSKAIKQNRQAFPVTYSAPLMFWEGRTPQKLLEPGGYVLSLALSFHHLYIMEE